VLSEELQKIQDSRQGVYGPWEWNMLGTSVQMCGMLANRLAAAGKPCAAKAVMDLMEEGLMSDLAPLFMLAIKTNRIASGNYVKDNFADSVVYLSFVERMQMETLLREESAND